MALPLLEIGAGLSAFGNIRGGILAKKQGKQIEEESELLAGVMLDLQRQDDEILAQQQHQRRSAMAAEFGASGVGLEGSALDVLLAQVRNDVIIRSREQFKVEMQARGVKFSGDQAKAEGKNAFFQSLLAAGSSGVAFGSEKGFFS